MTKDQFKSIQTGFLVIAFLLLCIILLLVSIIGKL
jgi:hypothetical protein